MPSQIRDSYPWKIRVYRFLALLIALVRRDITARYRRSGLGFLWALLQPLILMVLFNMLRGFVDISSDGIPYVLFSYAALVPWTFFSNAISFCAPSVVLNAQVIKKIALPREAFPLAAVTTALFDFLTSGLVLIGMMLWYRVPLSWVLLWLPVLVCLTALLAFGVGMLVASLGAFRLDFILATPFLLQFWLYATPVIYPLSSVPDRWRTLYVLNPMVGLIEGFRNVFLRGMSPLGEALGWSVLMTALVLAITWLIFRWLAPYLADTV